MSSSTTGQGRLAGKVAIVTGAAMGQGAGIARAYVAEGARTVLADVAKDEGEALAQELDASHPGMAVFRHHDVSDEGAWTSLVEQTVDRWGPVTVLANNAGILRFGNVGRLELGDVDLMYRVNQLGTLLGMNAVARTMRKAGGGSIINASSTEGLGGMSGCVAYGGTKFAIRGMTKGAAHELGPHGIRVNSVHPGGVATPMVLNEAMAEWVGHHPSFSDAQQPLLRLPMMEPGDISDAMVYLCGPAGRYLTGVALPVDAGQTLK